MKISRVSDFPASAWWGDIAKVTGDSQVSLCTIWVCSYGWDPVIDVGKERVGSGLWLTCEEVGEFDGQDDGFLQCFLSALQASDIIPPDVWFLHDDGACAQGQLGVPQEDILITNINQKTMHVYKGIFLTMTLNWYSTTGLIHASDRVNRLDHFMADIGMMIWWLISPMSCSCSFFFSGFSPSLSLSLLVQTHRHTHTQIRNEN